jgi:hypothetical protein
MHPVSLQQPRWALDSLSDEQTKKPALYQNGMLLFTASNIQAAMNASNQLRDLLQKDKNIQHGT